MFFSLRRFKFFAATALPVAQWHGRRKGRKGEEGREREKKEGKNKERSCVTALLSYPCPPC
jgi:hypothetical protein